MRGYRLLVSACLLVMMSATGCTVFSDLDDRMPNEAIIMEATLAASTRTQKMLQALPRATKPVTLSVYEFNDLTGQNKSAETAQYSRAVTQGGLQILKKALLDAGEQSWFRVLERGGLNNLLQERKIIRSMRQEYIGTGSGNLPPLLFSGVILEGGIVAYESNIMTGGVGARYLGIGGDIKYQRDMVTVSLSAVSVSTGEVLLAVSTSKTILSRSVQGGMYYFVSFDKILEAEAGYTTNEPPQFATRQAIEMAVYAMVMKGYKKGVWQFADRQAGADIYKSYRAKHDKKSAKALAKNSPEPEAQVPVQAFSSSTVQTAQNLPAGWYIQVLASRNIGGEEEMVISELKKNGLPVAVQETAFGSVNYYRIMVGGFSDQQIARNARTKLMKLALNRKSKLIEKVFVVAKM